MRISDWSSDVCSSDLRLAAARIAADRMADIGPVGGEQARAHERGEPVPMETRALFAYQSSTVVRRLARLVDDMVQDRKSVVSGKSVSVRVDLGGRRIIKQKNTYNTNNNLTNDH